jgi:Mor family transcriptional regulator
MPAYQKSWRRFLFKERNDKICRLWAEGMKLTILSERFNLTKVQIKRILREQEDG